MMSSTPGSPQQGDHLQ
uniref:Macaca fascicularis brain cDNA clone: QbsB-10321, similar to human heat shock 90kDa protein 1, alpha (HSPCA), mRNA, RefSeq: NM_005348.2 n=1 Tax=Macaca fascicularis TaxID=9541 RepID=I7G7H3_MACFA|nr:unnamed protein product [Macaca fascicularis]